MAKVLILTNTIDSVYIFRKELVVRLRREGYDVTLAGPKGTKESFFNDLGCTCVEAAVERRGKNPIEDIALFRRYRAIIRAEQPDIVLTYTIKPNIYGGMAAKSLGVPFMENITGLGSAMENSGMMQKLALALYKFSCGDASCIFFQNEENLKFFQDRKLLHGSSRLVAGSGVNLEQYRALDYEKGDQLHFIFISRVMKEKGIEEYLQAAEAITGKYPQTVFHIVGACQEDYKERLEEMESRGIVRYHGYQKNMTPFYAMSHCTIHPTFYPEGMSNVLLESSASGRPVITTNRSGCREIVDEGVNGFFVEKQNAEDLVRVIEKFITLPYEQRKAMGLAGRKKVERSFDRKKVMQVYMEEIRHALSGKELVPEQGYMQEAHPHYRRMLLNSQGVRSTGWRR